MGSREQKFSEISKNLLRKICCEKFDENLYARPRYINWLVILVINGLVNYNIIRKEKVNFTNAHQTKFDNDKILAA